MRFQNSKSIVSIILKLDMVFNGVEGETLMLNPYFGYRFRDTLCHNLGGLCKARLASKLRPTLEYFEVPKLKKSNSDYPETLHDYQGH